MEQTKGKRKVVNTIHKTIVQIINAELGHIGCYTIYNCNLVIL